MTTGQRIRTRRQELNLSQIELSRRMGYSSKSAISKVENSLSDNLTYNRIAEFAEALETSIPYLLGITSNADSLQKTQKPDGINYRSGNECPNPPAQDPPERRKSIDKLISEQDEKIGIIFENTVAIESRLRAAEKLIAELVSQQKGLHSS